MVNNQEQKTIFIIIIKSFIIRNILRSGSLELLKRSGHRIIIFIQCHKIPSYLKEEFEDEQVKLVAMLYSLSRWHKLFSRVQPYLLLTGARRVIIYYGQNSKSRQKYRKGYLPPNSPIRTWIVHNICKLTSKVTILKFLFRWLELRFFLEHNEAVKRYFDQYRPDLIFSGSIISSLDIGFMKEAKRRGIKTVSMPKTWDNLTNLFYRFLPDYLLVQNEMLVDIAYNLQWIPKEKIYVIGMPQFDWYKKGELILKKEEYFNKRGLDSNRALIFFGSSGIWAANDHVLAEKIYEWIINNELERPCQLLVRAHFSNVRDDIFKNLRDKNYVLVDDYRISDFFNDNWDQSIEEMINFINSVTHCDIMINIASTLSLDAACADRPIINPTFNCSFQGDKDVTLSYHYSDDHYRWVLDTKATKLANSYEELKNHINFYLQNPRAQAKERENLRQKLCYKVDGHSSERLVRAINEILNK